MKKENEVQGVQLLTPEGETLRSAPDLIPWSEYPRPALQRDHFLCLNGSWEFCRVREGESPDYARRIRVPFPPESILSGIGEQTAAGEQLCYRRRVTLPPELAGGRILLHVDAADQLAQVQVNGIPQGAHVGGYERFSLDVTDALCDGENTVEILVTDRLDDRVLPYGKQKRARGGMWYTPVSGIWQSVWMERVPARYVTGLDITADAAGADVFVRMNDGCAADARLILQLPEGAQTYPMTDGHVRIDPKEPLLWSPESPHLYRFTVEVGEDRVASYFALRTLEIKEYNGTPRLCLNGKPYFFHGLLDQGYFSDGIFLPATPEGYERDILLAKRMGFNMLRKHIKLEPDRFYYDCDRLGIAVFQDMINNGDYSFLRDTALPTVGFKRRNDRRMHRDRATREAFLKGMEQTVRRLKFHPCVCYWTIFNEGWGQFDHAGAYRALKELDGTRFVDSVSGWFLPPRGQALASDVESIHVYFKPVSVNEWKKPLVLSEFGGYAHRVEGHIFNPDHNYGYRTFAKREQLEQAILALYENEVIPLAARGLCADVYTQLTDVEDETNGLITYDRRVEKADAEQMRELARKLHEAADAQWQGCSSSQA